MSPTIILEPVDDVPTNSRVCHYDELGEDAKEEFPLLAEDSDTSVDSAVVDGLQQCDLIKYTDYYEVSIG